MLNRLGQLAWAAAGLMVLLPAGLSAQQAVNQPVNPPLNSPLTQTPNAEPAFFTVPFEQTVTIEITGATRVISVNPATVQATILLPGVIELRGVAFGQTFIHYWTETGRITRPVHVVPPPIPEPVRPPTQPRTASEVSDHLTFEYQDRFLTRQRGPSLDNLDLNTTTIFDHNLAGQMATPRGRLAGRVAYQRVNSFQDISTWGASLTDGDFGLLRHFDVSGGDVGVGFSDFSVPYGTVRGIAGRYYDISPFEFDSFYGRKRLGFTSGLSPGVEPDDNQSITGFRLQDTVHPLTWSMAYATAMGDDRIDTQTSQAVDVSSWYWLNGSSRLGIEGGRNNEDAYGYRLRSIWQYGTFNLDTAYRNISQRYENLYGRAAGQGERGFAVNGQWAPWRWLRLREHVDIFQDNLFKNSEEPDALNMDFDFGGDVELTRSTLWNTAYQRQRFLGRLFPTDTVSVTTGLRQRLGNFPLLTHGTVFSEYQFRDTRSVSAPESDFDSHTVRVGIGAPLTDYFSWQANQQWSWIEETLSGASSVPRQTNAGLNYYQQLLRIPLSLRSGINFSTADSAGSANSFVANEDRWAWDAGLRYDFSTDAHAFFDYRLTRVSRPASGREYEMEMQTGVRYFFDTGIAWEPSATFSGIVFKDDNGDGAKQEAEPGLSRVVLRTTAEKTATTDPGGRFYLGRIRGHQVEISVDLTTIPEGYVPTTPATVEVDITKPPKPPLLFGFATQAELRVRVFIDAQGNGQYDAMDVPLEKVRLSLEGGTTVSTDRSGWAFFRGIRPDLYRVSLNLADLAAGFVPATAVSRELAVAEGKAVTIDFPINAERSIAGRVFVDRNRNSQWDEEPVLPGTPVCLDGSRRVKTREDGRYLFKGVSAGSHRLSVNCGLPLARYLPLGAMARAVEVPPQPVQLDREDFRFIEQEALMQDVVADVLRQREMQQQLVDEMIESKKSQKAQGQSVDRSP